MGNLVGNTVRCWKFLIISESEERPDQNQEREGKPSQRKEETEGACGTAADEKPGN